MGQAGIQWFSHSTFRTLRFIVVQVRPCHEFLEAACRSGVHCRRKRVMPRLRATQHKETLVKPKLRRTSFLMLAILLLAHLVVAQASPQITPFSADMSYSSVARNSRPARDMDGKIYFGHDHMRLEMQGGPRGPSVILTNFQTQVTDILLPQQQMYIEHKMGEMAARRPGMMPNIKPLHDPNNPCVGEEGATCKNLGVEQVNGRACDHWQIADKDGRITNSWIDQKLHIPIKSVSEDGTLELTNIKEGEAEAVLFQIPAGYQKIDPSNMRGGPPQQ